jgi:predicted DNA-binding protein
MAKTQLNILVTPELMTRMNKAAGAVALKTGEMPKRATLVRELLEAGLDQLEKLLVDEA